MKHLASMVVLVFVSIFMAACGASAATPAPTPTMTASADSAIISEGRVEPIRYADLALSASGLVSEVLVQEGQQVKAGDVIARLESSEVHTLDTALASTSQELTSAYGEVRDAQFELDNFDVPSSLRGLTPTEAVVQTLEKLNIARVNFEPYKYLDERRLEATKSEIRTGVYRDRARLCKKQLDDAWANYRKAIQWMELESDLIAANASLARAKSDYEALHASSLDEGTAGARAALANAELRAPFSGIITKLQLKVGEFASAGEPVVTLADMSAWVIKTTDLTEIDVVELVEGDPVTVTLDAIPGVDLKGNIISISQDYSENQGDIVYEVTLLLADKNPAMRWGMTAAVNFENQD